MTAADALARAIQAAHTAEQHLGRGFVTDGNAAARAHAQVSQAWTAIAAELTYRDIQLPAAIAGGEA